MAEINIHRQLLDRVNDAIMVSTGDRLIVFANEAASRLTGYSLDELLGMDVLELPTPQDAIKIRERLASRLAGEAVSTNYETTLVRKDKQVRVVQITAAGTQWQGQAASVAVVRDITEQKETESALLQSEELLRTVLENAPGFVFSYDIDQSGKRHSTYIGVGLKDLLGPETALEVGQSIPAFIERIHPEDFQRLIDRGIFETSYIEPIDLEYRVLGDNDQYRWIHNTMRSQALPGGRIRWYGMMRDVTERRKTAEELARLRRIEAIGVMAGGIAHEVNNALHPARISFQILAEKLGRPGELAPDKLRQLIDRAEQSVERAVRTTGAIRQFARVVGHTDMHSLPLRGFLQEILTDTVDSQQPPVESSVDIPPDLHLEMNRDHAHSIFANILSNAVDALQGQAVRRITIVAEQNEQQTRIVITDTGTGIEESVRDRIFEPFVSSKPRTGTGIGLAICQRLLELYGGTIALEAAPGGGACVTIAVPTRNGQDNQGSNNES